MCVLVLTNSCCVRICLIFRVFLAQTVYIVAITAGGMEYGFVLFLLATALNSMSNRISCDIYILICFYSKPGRDSNFDLDVNLILIATDPASDNWY